MSSPSTTVTDAVGLSVVLVATLFSPAVAEVVGPYVVIAAAAVIGASFGLARRPPSSRWAALGYFVRVVGLAILLTVGLSTWIVSRHPEFTQRALLAPVALLIGFGDWPAVLAAAMKGIFASIFKAVDSFRPGGPQ